MELLSCYGDVMRMGNGWLALMMLGLMAGCRTVEFYSQAVVGQVEVLAKRRPIDRVAAKTTDLGLRERLVLTERVTEFARDELLMPSGGSYGQYADLGRDHLVWVVYGAPELSLEAKHWWYPVVGRQDYRGFFREDLARAEAERLEARGYETWINEADAYSTLGWFRDPVLNTFVHREQVDFVELLFHELCHRKYYVRGNTRFSEGMAVAVAREGVRRWFQATGQPGALQKYEARLARIEQARVAIEDTTERLRVIYEGSGSDPEKRDRKARELSRLRQRLAGLRSEWNRGLKDWIEKPTNNARLISFTTYEAEVGRFVKLLDECGGDFEEFWKRVKLLDPQQEVEDP